MKVTTVRGLVCPHCDEFIEEGAIPAKKNLDTRYECGECGETYTEREEARDCCKE